MTGKECFDFYSIFWYFSLSRWLLSFPISSHHYNFHTPEVYKIIENHENNIVLFREPPLDLETLVKFLVVEKYPRIHFFIDEIPAVGKIMNLFKGLNIEGTYEYTFLYLCTWCNVDFIHLFFEYLKILIAEFMFIFRVHSFGAI